MASQFNLPGKLEQCVQTLAAVYGSEGNRQMQEILVNSELQVEEAIAHEYEDVPIVGHGAHLSVPEKVFLGAVKRKIEIQKKLKEDLNRYSYVTNEFVAEVFLEMQTGDADWRKRSGVQVKVKSAVSATISKRIWGEAGFKVFMCHRDVVKVETAVLQEKLAAFGVSSFVAHNDIPPTQEWQEEIVHALDSMDGFLALMTDSFHESEWTDQEVGIALGRGVPMISINVGRTPYGFIGKFQALTCSWDEAPVEIMNLLIVHDRCFASYIEMLKKCPGWDPANVLGLILPGIESLRDDQIDALVAAYNSNRELQFAYRFNGRSSTNYGPGLVHHLHRWTARRFQYSPDWTRIEIKGTKPPPAPSARSEVDFDVPF